MKIEVAKSDLDHAMQIVNVGSGSGADLTGHILFRHTGKQTEVMAYNGRSGASSPLVCNTTVGEDEEMPAFTVEGWRLTQWLRATSDAALVLESEDGTVTATAPAGSVRFRSLDPSGFPFWDKQLSSAKKTMEIEATRLQQSLSHSKGFISSADTTRPEMAVTEIRDGILWATDQAALSMVTLDEFSKASIRVHGKDIGSVTAFLGLSGDEKVEVLEHKRSVFFRRSDGSVLNVSRPTTPFLELEDIEENEDAHWWTVSKDAVLQGIGQLTASAPKEELRLTFNFDAADQKITMSMPGVSGTNQLKIECPEFGSSEDAEEGMPKEGWTVEYPYITRLFNGYKGGKSIRFGLNPSGEDGGWTKVVEDRDGDKYLTILVWMPE